MTTGGENFKATRLDGRSDSAIIYALVADAEPDRVFTYEELIRALSIGTTREIDRVIAGRAVRSVRAKLLSLNQRTMVCVPNLGYRVARAGEHQVIALGRRRRGQRQIRWAIDTLRHVRWDEMDPNTRMAHEAQLTLTGALYQMVEGMSMTQRRHERLLQSLIAGQEAKALQGPEQQQN